jgi:methyl-accepting chemotaxis protein
MMESEKDRKKIHRRRKLRFLSNKFQREFIVRFCVVVVLGAFISGAIIYGMSKATVTTVFEGARLKIKSTADFILPTVLFSSAVVIVFMGLAIITIIAIAYRRMEKPLYKMEQEIEEADKGNLNVSLTLGKDDEFKVLARSLHKLIRDFREVVVVVKEDVVQLESGFEDLEKQNACVIPQKMKDDLKSLKEELGKLNT